jgi:Methyltransferase domain
MPPGALRDVDLVDIGFDAPGRVRQHVPSPRGVLGRILRRREISREDVFIEVGCGMGPVLVEAAAHYDFRRVIGIDVVPQFTQVARETVARGRKRWRCEDIEIVTGDAISYEMPDDVTVVYMFDPFLGPIFDAFLAKLITSVDHRPRRMRIIYNFPVEGGLLERTGRARLVRYGRRRNRPWATAPDLAMYEIEPAGDGVLPGAPRSPKLSRGIRSRLFPDRHADGTRSGGVSTRLDPREPVIRITSGASSHGSSVVSAGSTQLDSARIAFERQHCVRLPRFLDDAILDRIQRYVDEGEFSARSYDGIRTDLRMDRGKAVELMLLFVNDPHLFELVRTITGCRRIGRFDGSVYRVMPGPEHEESWHGEIFGHGMVEMGIDLSTRPYSGGVLEVRDRDSQEVVHREADTEPGDAVLLRVAPFVQHRYTAVEGDSPRTVYAGRFMWFKRGSGSKLARPGSRGFTTDAEPAPRRPLPTRRP